MNQDYLKNLRNHDKYSHNAFRIIVNKQVSDVQIHFRIQVVRDFFLIFSGIERLNMEETKTKCIKKKGNNWDEEERTILIDFCTENSNLLDTKYDNTITKDKKNKAWQTISSRLAQSNKSRSPKACKRKWQNIKLESTKSVRSWVKVAKQTGNLCHLH